ncbi:MAG: leucine--tRNA ligase [Candidatus Pacebacteria bacterium]|nr:leucine--tRNA ligase [Candidatus Paceibacterota bacterium]
MHKRFDHKEIEKKWQENWKETGLYNAGERDKSKEKEYILVEWPYPSGNLHIGHWYAFAVPDIYVRYRRMMGKQVLFPMGFDAFGLPAENAAIKRNINPREWTEQNIEYMKDQLKSMGNAFSWDRTTSSTDPEYYKWTQWMFTQFFENNIAYRGEGIVNWCPGCHTVIANEQVLADGTCERSGDVIEKKRMPQWMIRITDFADDLIDDLDALAWPEHIKEAQRQWIGRSKGAEIDFKLSTGDQVTVFTTRPDTLFGATYLVLAPEHVLVEQNKATIANWDEVTSYVQTAKQKSEIERGDNTKEKTGVKLEGITATNPANGESIPVYVADYVLGGYGTGAIMAVPAHDERDNAFAEKFNLLIKTVIAPHSVQTVTHLDNGTPTESPMIEWVPYFGEGKLINSSEFDGMTSEEAKIAITKKVGGRMTNTYRLRDWSIGRQRYWGVPIPIVYDPDGKAHVVPKEHLPWTLPEDVDFTPTGVPPLAKSEELKTRTERIFGAGWTPEVETMDTFVDSSWYFLRYLDNKNDEALSSAANQKDWMQVDMYFGGAEHTTMHLLYSRFWQKALHKLGLAVHNEPYRVRINRGLILGPDGNKMSKSKGNVVDPDEQVKLVGADTVKMYLAFMGPYQGTNYPWDLGGVAGLRRFLERVYGLRDHIIEDEPKETLSLLHKTIKKVGGDIAEFKFNTAISSMMIFMNQAEKTGLTKESYLKFLQMLAPFAPHLTEELWALAGIASSIHTTQYPTYDENLAKDDLVTIGVQINGKHRGKVTISPEATQDEAWKAIGESPDLVARMNGQAVKKIIYVPARILNIIVE